MIKQQILPVFILAFLIGITFWQLPQTFFQQDEWWAFGNFIAREQDGGFEKIVKESFFSAGKAHATPLTDVIVYLQYKFFDLSFPPYAYMSIILHTATSVVLFVFLNRLFKNAFLPLISALFFAASSISSQAVSWVSASINTQGALLFGLLSLLSLNNLPLSLAFLFISLLLKETSVVFFVLIPAIWLLFFKRGNAYSSKKIFVSLAILGLAYASLRFLIWIQAPTFVVDESKLLTQPDVSTFIFRLLILPFRAIAQSLISQAQMIDWANKLTFVAYPHYFVTADGSVNPFISQSIVFDLVGLLAAVAIMLIMWFQYKYLKIMLISFLFMVLGVLPIIFIPGKPGFASIIEPRHLYVSQVGAGLFLSVLISSLHSKIKSKFGIIVSFVIVLAVLGTHIKNVKKDTQQLVDTGNIRKTLVTKIKEEYPRLPNSVVFYTQSDTSYYGMPESEKILPVQVGFGQMLLVWNYKSAQFPACLFEGNFFLDILAQGYRFCDDRGFGYFRDYAKLVKSLRENQLKSDSVIAYSWEDRGKMFTNVTGKIRVQLDRDL